MKYNDADGCEEREEQSAKDSSRIKNVCAVYSFMRARKYSKRKKKSENKRK